MRCRHHLSVALLLLLLSAPRVTLAEVPPQDEKPLLLTSQGRFLVGGDLSGNWSNDGGPYYRALRRWYLDGSAKLTYFVRDHLGIGASLGGGYSSRIGTTILREGGAERANHVSVGVHAIVNWQLAPRLSFMFQPALLYIHQWLRGEGGVRVEEDGFTDGGSLDFQPRRESVTLQLGYVRTALSIPLVFHASPSVALGFGPMLWLDIILKRSLEIGDDVYHPSPASGPLPRRTRFQAGLFTTIMVAI